MLDKIKQIISEIGSFTATTPAEVEQFRIKHLSKKGTIAALFDDFKNVPADPVSYTHLTLPTTILV